jgi:hypothetical protein
MLFMKINVPFDDSLSLPLSVMTHPFSGEYEIEQWSAETAFNLIWISRFMDLPTECTSLDPSA